ncbi:MAG TPA: TIGR00296 family protein [archaeon]|nr:TIGR00296 family protein [archaeon]
MSEMKDYSLEQGQEIVKLARKSIKFFLLTGNRINDLPSKKFFEEKRGAIISVKSMKDKTLLGSLGFPEAKYSLWDAVIEGAINAATRDPRFKALKSSDLDKVLIEVSVLSKAKEIKTESRDQLLEEIHLGEDGLIAEKENKKALMLPYEPIIQKWSVKTFLEEICFKAGLLRTSWRERRVHFYKFQTQTFIEEEPEGKVIES